MSNKFKAHIHPHSVGDDNTEIVGLELFNPDGSPAAVGGGGAAIASYLEGHIGNISVVGSYWYAPFDGSESGIDIVGFDMTASQAIELPPGIYTSSWDWTFDTTADDGSADTARGFSAQIQPLGRTLESYVKKPAGGWADANPYMTMLGWNFIVPEDNPGSDLIVSLDASTSGDTDVRFWLNFTVIRLGDIPAETG